MKKLILLILLVPMLVWSQQSVQSMAPNKDAITLWSSATITGSTTPSWSAVFPLDYQWGAATIFIDPDTTAASASGTHSDSCATLFLQIKDKTLGWTKYYDDAANWTRLDSIDRAFINVGTSATPLRMNLTDVTSSKQWSTGDSARIGITIGVGDSLIVSGRIKIF